MSLQKGHKLGPYEIQAAVGSGGMGEVYKAEDTRLGRTVAIKVLPRQMALDSDARARFEREAKTISSLNHPNICTLHDIGHENGVDFLVMECLEGETLADRLTKGKLDTADALSIGGQIASALDAAHRKGIIHRDLKPGNIYLTKDGAKLLDFGLAKLHAETVTGMSDQTETTPVTGAGAIVGTLQYMSPEQLEGREADARSDIFAFGAVLYEMITGERAFFGTSKASLIGSIMKEQPRSITELQPTSPPAMDRLIKKCLQKDPDKRWQSAADLKDELDWIASAGSQAGIPAPVSSKRRVRRRLAWVVAGVCAVAAIVLGIQRITMNSPESQTVRFSVPIPAGVDHVDWPLLSPDGQYLAFLGFDSGGISQIWIRPLSSQQAHPLPGTENSWRPFWSPDSRYLAFFDGALSQLKKVSIVGGQPQVICKARGADGTWSKDDIILFDEFETDRIGQVSASGGQPRAIAAVPDTTIGEFYFGWPCFLPDGRHFIFCACEDSLTRQELLMRLKIGSIDSDETRALAVVEGRAFYSDPGYIIYMKNGFLVAHRFNVKTLELEGEAVPLTDSVSIATNSSKGMNAGTSSNGSIAWLREPRGPIQSQLVWIDRDGRPVDTVGLPHVYTGVELSPDDLRVASSIQEDRDSVPHVWITDLQRGTSYRLTSEREEEGWPIWSPDGRAIAYFARPGSLWTLKRCSIVDPTPSLITGTDTSVLIPLIWHESNELLFSEIFTRRALMKDSVRPRLCSVDLNDLTRNAVLDTLPSFLLSSEVSPDHRYVLAEGLGLPDSGNCVYDVSAPARRWRLSAVGTMARWSPRGDEIFFFENEDFMSVKVDLVNGFGSGTPQKLFTRSRIANSTAYWQYDVAADGKRFLFMDPVEPENKTTGVIEITLNWDAGLKR